YLLRQFTCRIVINQPDQFTSLGVNALRGIQLCIISVTQHFCQSDCLLCACRHEDNHVCTVENELCQCHTVSRAILIMRGYWQRGVRYIHLRAREKRRGVTIFAHSKVDEVKAWPIEWRRGVFFQEEGIFLGSLNRRKFTFDAMNVRSLNLNMSQQYIPRLTVTAARVIWRNAAFITPEDMYFVPINFIAKICCEQLKETSRSTASVERDQELIAFQNGLCGLLA